jgi:hypothetical protein
MDSQNELQVRAVYYRRMAATVAAHHRGSSVHVAEDELAKGLIDLAAAYEEQAGNERIDGA